MSHSVSHSQQCVHVFVKGNDRTRSEYIGLYGYITQALHSMGGWVSVTLEDGQVVNLQRNALVILPDVENSINTDFDNKHNSTLTFDKDNILSMLAIHYDVPPTCEAVTTAFEEDLVTERELVRKFFYKK